MASGSGAHKMGLDWNVVRGAAAVAGLAVTLIGGGYSIWADVGLLKRDVSTLTTLVEKLRCAIEPDAFDCKYKQVVERNS